jgi:hypothetical protein
LRVFCCVYRFLSISANMAPTTAIAIMMPMVAGRKYRSARDAGGAVGAGVVAGASDTDM